MKQKIGNEAGGLRTEWAKGSYDLRKVTVRHRHFAVTVQQCATDDTRSHHPWPDPPVVIIECPADLRAAEIPSLCEALQVARAAFEAEWRAK